MVPMRDVVKILSDNFDITYQEAKDITASFVSAIVDILKDNGEINITGLGKFSTKMAAARKARNPRTDEIVDVPAKRVPKFKFSKTVKDLIKEN